LVLEVIILKFGLFPTDNETNTKGEKVDYEVNPETRPKEFKEIKKDEKAFEIAKTYDN
jgi:hypothetical protein